MRSYYTYIKSPIGRLMLTANDRALTGLYFSTGDKARKEPGPDWQASEARFEQADSSWRSTLPVNVVASRLP